MEWVSVNIYRAVIPTHSYTHAACFQALRMSTKLPNPVAPFSAGQGSLPSSAYEKAPVQPDTGGYGEKESYSIPLKGIIIYKRLVQFTDVKKRLIHAIPLISIHHYQVMQLSSKLKGKTPFIIHNQRLIIPKK